MAVIIAQCALLCKDFDSQNAVEFYITLGQQLNHFSNIKSFRTFAFLIGWLYLISLSQLDCYAGASTKAKTKKAQASSNTGSVYPQFRSSYGIIHWLPEQMPLKVYVSPGQSIEKIIDPNLGACAFNVDSLDRWPDVAASLLQQPEQLAHLPRAAGFFQEYYQAAIDGINEWKPFEKEGLFSFVLTDNPSEADIYVFWVNHFVTKLGFGLLANDINGLTAKRSFHYNEILAGAQPAFKPVVTLLRTTNQRGDALSLCQIKSAAAHEFGHALGIEGHSTNPQDLMSVFYGKGYISANDAATIRHLYHTTPDLVP